ncbi:hypothetical protein FGO68_gene16779 [Halteria grandinella]|uniref:Uncharacterized protein n=1 Tax=Halteria grandinella TaxID=5974 RepID=A0A8J8T9L1_HALGN|nr:hypothetical protein FGO68_gene16779 [Halteria grandinella]
MSSPSDLIIIKMMEGRIINHPPKSLLNNPHLLLKDFKKKTSRMRKKLQLRDLQRNQPSKLCLRIQMKYQKATRRMTGATAILVAEDMMKMILGSYSKRSIRTLTETRMKSIHSK